MATRRLSLALVLVLLAGVLALSPASPPSQAEPCERTDALESASSLSKLRRSLKRLDTTRRRAPAQEQLPALPARGFVLATAEAVRIVETVVATIRHHRVARRRAHARAPPSAS